MAPSTDRLANNGNDGYGSTNAPKSWWQQQPAVTISSNNSGSYQSVNTSESFTSFRKELSLYEDAAAQQKRRNLVRSAKVLVVCLLAFGLFQCLRDNGSDPNDSNNDFSYKYVEESNSVTFPPPPVKGKRQPFSRLHPSQLGIPQFSRPTSTGPSVVLTNNETVPPGTPFPTNAWYQNMLLAREGEPTEIHRAYATPFLVDAVGPIPGIRVMPNQVSASTSVIQINNLVEHGLTVGASPLLDTMNRRLEEDDSSSTTTTTTAEGNSTTDGSDSDGGNSTARTFSNEYRVDRMTPLGLTLGWVSLWLLCILFLCVNAADDCFTNTTSLFYCFFHNDSPNPIP